MTSHHGQAVGQSAWARARLQRGTSGGAIWEINSDYPEARLTLGADPGAGWPITAHGVHPIHCELFWDGRSLWVADTHVVGGVFLDGARVTDWVQIRGPAELRFGQAALDFETSAMTHERMVGTPELAKPITLTDMVVPSEPISKPIFGGAASDLSSPDIESAKTRVVSTPAERRARDNDPTQQVGHGANGGALRPRLGGGKVAPVSHADATKMVPMPAAPPDTPPSGHMPGSITAPPPPPAFGPYVEGGASFVGPPETGKTAPTANKTSPIDKIVAFLRPQTSAEVLEASGAKKTQALPVRTWILLGVTLASAVGLLLWENEPEEEVPAGPPVVQTPVVGQPPIVQPPIVQPPIVQPPIVQPPIVEPPIVEPPSPIAEAGSPPQPAAEVPVTSLQRQAADLYIAGSYAEALPLYRQLAQASPQDASYSSMVRILERRLAQRCRDGVGPGGEPCTEP